MKNIDMKQAIPQASEDEMNEKRIFIEHILPMLETASLSKVECVYWLLLKW